MTVKYKRLVNIVSAWWTIKSRTEFTEEIVGVVFVRKLCVWNGSFKFRVPLKVRYGRIRTVIADSCRMDMSKRDMWSNMNPLRLWYCYGSVPSSFESLEMSKGIGGVSVYASGGLCMLLGRCGARKWDDLATSNKLGMKCSCSVLSTRLISMQRVLCDNISLVRPRSRIREAEQHQYRVR